ncbi:hypothetical protein EDB85DRAFT_2287181 [Lactarius pseudohatsudake]|nr:hypothetical protein EDB85DRAFT_2287181 [Lactarius pseudohatsudake]
MAKLPQRAFPAARQLPGFPRTDRATGLRDGSFSNYFQAPSYQHNALSRPLRNLGGQYDGLYKCIRCRDLTSSYFVIRAAPRGFPDIAAQAHDFSKVVNGDMEGTRRGIISLFNDLQLSHDKPTLGFLNP